MARGPKFKEEEYVDQTGYENNKGLQSPKIIKKYGNRKLYDTEQSSYVVLKDIERMIRNKEEIQVIDNETQDDITISTLTQIIFSSEKKSKVSPPVNVLKSIIREGDGSFSSFLAKLGLFELDEKKKEKKEDGGERKLLTSVFSSGKNNSEDAAQSLEQKITKLINSGEELDASNSEDSIPELPGNHMS